MRRPQRRWFNGLKRTRRQLKFSVKFGMRLASLALVTTRGRRGRADVSPRMAVESPLVAAISAHDQRVLAVRLAIAGLAGACLGTERRRRRQHSTVGARTMTLVSVG